MNCKICSNTLGKKSKYVCTNCNKIKHKLKCVKCNKEYSVTAHYYIKVDAHTHMCKQCKLCGVGNPNYGKNWSHDMRNVQSDLIKSKVDEKYRLDCAKGMKGKSISLDTILKRKKTNEEKALIGYTRPKHSECTKKIIGIKSKEKFTNEYFISQRKRNEENGAWIPLSVKNDYALYKELANWKSDVITENLIGIHLLKLYQFKSKTNNGANSLVRDHMYGRKAAFENGVFPELIRHPANCQLITHSDNIKKSKSNNDCIISLDDLFERISNWDAIYYEQSICLELINKYKNGLRYSKENYIINYYG